MLKRFFDLFLSYLGLFILFPLWIIFVFAILLEDGFPVFYIQERVGKKSKIFRAFKFRTMYYRKKNSGIARLLRTTALDESPQLINIIKGEMSFVGPRPLIPQEISSAEKIDLRFGISPGLTGIAQIAAPKQAPIGEKIKYDLWYIDNQSILLDIQLILKSFWLSLNRRWDIIKTG